MCHAHDEQDINYQDDCLQVQGNRCVSCARNGVKVCIAEALEQGGTADDENRRNHQLCEIQIIGIDSCHLCRENCDQDYDRYSAEQAILEHFGDGREYLFGVSRSNDSADQRVGGRGEGKTWRNQDHVNTSGNGGDAGSRFPHFFNQDKEDEPDTERKEFLEHRRCRNFQDISHQAAFDLVDFEQAEFLVPQACITVYREKQEGGHLCTERRDGGSGDAHFREPAFAENQAIVQDDVDHRHDESRVCNDLGVGDPDVQGAVQEVETYESNTKLAVPDVLDGGIVNVGRINQLKQQLVRTEIQDREQD